MFLVASKLSGGLRRRRPKASDQRLACDESRVPLFFTPYSIIHRQAEITGVVPTGHDSVRCLLESTLLYSYTPGRSSSVPVVERRGLHSEQKKLCLYWLQVYQLAVRSARSISKLTVNFKFFKLRHVDLCK